MYKSLEEIIKTEIQTGKPFWKIVQEDDCRETGASEEESFEKMRCMYQAMKDADAQYDGTLKSASGLVGTDGEKIRKARENGTLFCGAFVGKIMEKALKTSESNACMKRIVAAPTAGSCGVVPAVFLTLQEEKGFSEEQMVKALYVAAGIGGVIASRAFLAGAAGGCQAEIGSGSGMAAGADMSAVSMHKSGGSLTQSSILLTGRDVNADYVRQIINLTQTTSASYLLLSSLDISRRNLALRGEESFAKVAQMSEYARQEINSIGGYYAYGRDLVNGTSIYDYDVTKLSIYTLDIGLAGIEVYDLLRDEYDIQIEFGDICNILAYISIGDRIQDIERLVGALEDIKRLYSKDKTGLLSGEYINPKVAVSPQEAFYSQKKSVRIMDAVGAVSGEFVMCYPPGIPILAPGELITKEIAQYIVYAKEKGCSMQGTEDPAVEYLKVLEQ